MVLKNEIRSAIASHSIWKSRLQIAIKTGALDIAPNIIAKDDQCPFGEWLNRLEPADSNSEEYKRVKKLHTSFHHAAAKVAELALAGNKAEADNLLSSNGEYSVVTTKLIMELQAWAEQAS